MHIFYSETRIFISSSTNRPSLRLDPNYSEASRNLFIAYRSAGKYYGEKVGNLKISLEYLLQAYALNDSDYEILRLLGVAYGVQGDHVEAVKYFRRAVDIKPEDADAWSNLGKATYYLGNIEEANQYFERARRINPGVLND